MVTRTCFAVHILLQMLRAPTFSYPPQCFAFACAILLQDAWMRGAHIEGFPHYAVQNKPPGQSVIGSQPVSLDRENLELLRRKR